MNRFFKAIVLSALLGSTSAQQKENGEDCDTSVKLSCEIKGGEFDGQPCANLASMDCAKERNLQYTFHYCNNNEMSIVLRQQMTNPKIDNVVLSDFNKNKMIRSECRTVKKNKSYNTCSTGQAAAGMTLNAWVEGHDQENSYYCYSYDFMKFKLRKKDDDVADDTDFLTASIDLQILTEFETYKGSESFISTDNLPNYTPNKVVDCEKTFRTTYTITNDGPVPVILGALVGDTPLEKDQIGKELKANEAITVTNLEDINICERNGEEVTVRATAVASDQANPSRRPGVDAESAGFQIPPIAPLLASGVPAVDCKYMGQDCTEYTIDHGCWEGEAVFSYAIQKVDLGCHSVDDIEIFFNNGAAKKLVHSHSKDYECTSKNICYGDEWALTERRFIAPCELSPPGSRKTIPITITYDFGDDKAPINCGWTPDPNGLFLPPIQQDPPQIDTPSPTPEPPAPTQNTPAVPDQIPPSTTTPDDRVVCEKRSDSLWFEFTGGMCDASTNGQRKLKNKNKKNYFICEPDRFNVTKDTKVEIDVNGVMYSEITAGDKIEVTGGPTNMYVVIRISTGGSQTVNLHSSCSGNLAIGDTFGALKLVGFYNSEQGKVGYYPEV